MRAVTVGWGDADGDAHGAESAGSMDERRSLTGSGVYSPSRRGSNAGPPMTRQPSSAATAALALQAATTEQLEHAKVELQRRHSSLAVTSHLADIMAGELSDDIVARSAGDGPATAAAATAAATTRRGSQLARQPSSQLATALHGIAARSSQHEIASEPSLTSIQMRENLDASDAEVCCAGSRLPRTQDNTHTHTHLTPHLPTPPSLPQPATLTLTLPLHPLPPYLPSPSAPRPPAPLAAPQPPVNQTSGATATLHHHRRRQRRRLARLSHPAPARRLVHGARGGLATGLVCSAPPPAERRGAPACRVRRARDH